MKFEVAYSARIQVEREKEDLRRLFSDPNPPATRIEAPVSDGQFVSRLGSKHVLWRRTDAGTAEILSVLDPSSAQ